jgi:hypothetical protein
MEDQRVILADTAPVDTGIEWLFVFLVIVAITFTIYAILLATGCFKFRDVTKSRLQTTNTVPACEPPTTTVSSSVPIRVV